MPYRVLKPIPTDDGQTIPTGEIVAAEGWRNLRQLVNGRFLVEVAVVEDAAEKPAKKARPAADK